MGLTIHERFLKENPEPGLICAVKGAYRYHHYVCDGLDDRGWGCGYRTIQTLASWIANRNNNNDVDDRLVPSIPDIQKTILKLDDAKSKQFVGSKEWIGCYETFLVLDDLFGVPCKLIHCQSGAEIRDHAEAIIRHFRDHGAPIPVGGDQDCSSKAIFGVRRTSVGFGFLVVDPHFVKEESTADDDPRTVKAVGESSGANEDFDSAVISRNYVRWMDSDQFSPTSFYNLCLPLVS